MKKVLFAAALLCGIMGGLAAQPDPLGETASRSSQSISVPHARWEISSEKISKDEFDIVFICHLDEGWYTYSTFLKGDEGPLPTTISISADHVELGGKIAESGDKIEAYDDMFGVTIVKFKHTAEFRQRVKLKSAANEVSGNIEFMMCDSTRCIPPKNLAFKVALK